MPFDGVPPVFLPYQQALLASVSAHAVTVVEKSRRTGFSWALAAIAVLTAASGAGAGGMDVFYMGYEKEMTREFIAYVADFARAFDAAAGAVEESVFTDPDRPDADIGVFRVRFASGFEVVALPSVARALRGKQGLVLLDEAAFTDDLLAILKAALALLIWGGKLVVCSTHNGDTNAFNTLVQDIRAGRVPYHLMRVTFDDALRDGLFRAICRRTGKAWSPEAEAAWRSEILARYRGNADEELHVIPNPTTGTVLPLVLIEARIDRAVPLLRWTAPPGFVMWPERARTHTIDAWLTENVAHRLAALPERAHALGVDFGRRGDATDLWPLTIGADRVRRTPFVIELRDTPFEQQRQVLYALLGGLPRLRAAALDAGGLGMPLAEMAMQRFGERVQPILLTEPWYREHMPPFIAGFEDGTITIPDSQDVVDDLRGLSLVRGVVRVPEARRQGTDGLSRHGDSAIAGALAWFASRQPPHEYDYRPMGRPTPMTERAPGVAWMRPPTDDDFRPSRGERAMRGGL